MMKAHFWPLPTYKVQYTGKRSGPSFLRHISVIVKSWGYHYYQHLTLEMALGKKRVELLLEIISPFWLLSWDVAVLLCRWQFEGYQKTFSLHIGNLLLSLSFGDKCSIKDLTLLVYTYLTSGQFLAHAYLLVLGLGLTSKNTDYQHFLLWFFFGFLLCYLLYIS